MLLAATHPELVDKLIVLVQNLIATPSDILAGLNAVDFTKTSRSE
jgi:hypothetical protein